MTISLVVAMAQNRVIGVNNDLPWHIPADLKRFRTLTTGKPVVMGRKTFESILSRNKKPLPDRPNIVISRSGYSYPGVEVYSDLKTAFEETAAKYPDQEIMCIGGDAIFKQTLPIADRIYLTVIEKDFEGDAWFPALDLAEWKITDEEKFSDPVDFKFQTLERI